MADISGYLQNIRNGARGEDVRDSIINALDKINKDNPAIVRPLNVTANGTYAGEGGIVYNPVTVNVPEGASQALSLTDINITENGEYSPDDGEAYRNITVEVPTYVNEIMNEEKVVYLEEGDKVYYALDDGYDGYSAVHVMSGGGGGGGGATYYVDFLNPDGTLSQRVTNVPFGGGAVYSKPLPTANSMRFVGWNPNPINVRFNMQCSPKFEDASYFPNQITDDWVTIAKNCQTNPDAYAIGQWKMLELPAFITQAVVTGYHQVPATQLKMQLVAKGVDVLEGENGYANTTWMSMTRYIDDDNAVILDYYLNADHNTGDLYWKNSALRKMFQGVFTEQVFPQEILPYIKRVIKRTYTQPWDNASIVYTAEPTIEWFWIPSSREIAAQGSDISKDTMGPRYFEGVSAESYEEQCSLKKKSDGTPVSCLTRSLGRVEPRSEWLAYEISSNGHTATLRRYGHVYTNLLRLGFCI